MSDLMLLGVLNAPLPDDPADLGIAEWTALRSAARSAGSRIEALELEKDVERQRAEARQGECEAKAQIIADLEHQVAEVEADAERLAAQVEALWPKSAGSCPALVAHHARKEGT